MTVFQIKWEEVPIITYPNDPISPEDLERLEQQLLRGYQLGQGPAVNSSNPFYRQGQ